MRAEKGRKYDTVGKMVDAVLVRDRRLRKVGVRRYHPGTGGTERKGGGNPWGRGACYTFSSTVMFRRERVKGSQRRKKIEGVVSGYTSAHYFQHSAAPSNAFFIVPTLYCASCGACLQDA